MVKTGKYTGRNANGKFIRYTPAIHSETAWDNANRPIEKTSFDAIKSKVIAYLRNKGNFHFQWFFQCH